MKAFTMVEVAYLAKRSKLTIARDAGEDERGGRGFAALAAAREIFSDRVRRIILRSQD